VSGHVLSLPRAQREVGWGNASGGRRLKRYLLKREKALGRRIMIRVGGVDAPPYRVTLSALRRYCPELFGGETTPQNAALFREYIRGIDQRICEKVAEQIAEHVEPRLDELWERDEQIMGNVAELAKRVHAIVGGPEECQKVSKSVTVRRVG
jgi:hypothetical protein